MVDKERETENEKERRKEGRKERKTERKSGEKEEMSGDKFRWRQKKRARAEVGLLNIKSQQCDQNHNCRICKLDHN